MKSSAAKIVQGSVAANLLAVRSAHPAGSDVIRIGLVGCGGRGCGAAIQALNADKNARLMAVADAFEDRLQQGLNSMRRQQDVSDRIDVNPDRQFVGFDGYKGVIASGVDVVLLATPPHFRPLHLKACIEAGKHAFVEKPVAVDCPGVRSVLETTRAGPREGPLYRLGS